jgi:ABC-type multidrug transport system fused ATPase/permease subunit
MKRNWIVHYLKQCRWLYVLSIVLLIVSIVTFLGITGVQKILIDDVIMKGDREKLLSGVLLFCAISFTYLFSWVAKDMLFERVDTKLKEWMREDYMKRLFQMPVSDYQNERIGGMLSQMGDLQRTSSIFAYQIPAVVENSLNLLLLSFAVGWFNPYILLLLLFFGVSYLIIGLRFAPKLKEIAKEVQHERSELHVHLEEGVSSTREVIAYHREQWEQQKMYRGFNRYFEKAFQAAILRNRQMFFTDPLSWGGNLALLGIGGYEVMKGHLSIGLFVVLYQFGIQLIQAVQGVYHSIIGLKEALVTVERAETIFSFEQINKGNQILNSPIESIQFRDVTFRYRHDREEVLKGLTFDIPIGSKVAIVGSSGGGKSTIAQLLVRFYEPGSGQLLVNGKPLYSIDRKEWCQKAAIVFQEPYLFPDTIENNIRMGRSYTQLEVEEACRIAQIHEIIMDFPQGYDTVLGERGINLSGGQRQRIAIARALLGKPDLLILDEATSALDEDTERKLQTALDTARTGKTTIVIAHRLSTVENADCIYVIDGGEVVEYGEHNQLKEDGAYYSKLVAAGN